jgi:hypothetical protein
MPVDVAARAEKLRAKLEWECRHDLRWAKAGHFAFNSLLVVGIGSSVAAGLLGFGGVGNPKIVGVIALIPAASAGALKQLQLHWRSMWHYRKRDQVDELLQRLEYGLSDPPTAEQVATIAQEYAEINSRMTLEWNKFFGTPIDAGVSRERSMDSVRRRNARITGR